MKSIILVCITCFLFGSAVYSQQPIEQRVDSLFRAFRDSGLAGSLLISKDHRVVLRKAYGYSNNERKTLNTTSTLFNTASVGKQFTMVAILQLEQKGLLKTTDYLAKFIGPFNDMRDSITLHHLLAHTSGMVVAGHPLNYASRDSFILSVKASQGESIAGQKHRYTNAGYIMLGAIIEIVSGMPYENYVRDNIFKPLKMKHTSFPWEAHTNKKLLATGYNTQRQPQPPQENTWGTRGPGHFVTTMDDLLVWIRAYDDKTFMRPEIREKIFKDYYPGADNYSWTKAMTKRNTRFYHKGGGRPDFETRMMWFPDDRIIILFSLNNDYNLARQLFIAIKNFMDEGSLK